MANWGAAIAAILGGAQGLGQASDDALGRKRLAALDALQASQQRFQQGTQSADLGLRARSQGFVPSADPGSALAAMDAASRSPVYDAFGQAATAAAAQQARAGGTMQIPTAGGGQQTYQYNPLQDPRRQAVQDDRRQFVDATQVADARAAQERTFTAGRDDAHAKLERDLAAQREAGELQRTRIAADASRESRDAGRQAADDGRHEVRAAQMRGEYNHLAPVEAADKYAANAAMALEGVRLAQQGNPMGHQMAITGFLRTTHPDAVVRTTDKGMLVEGQGIPGEVTAWVQRNTGPGGIVSKAALAYIAKAVAANTAIQRATLAPTQAFYGRQAGADSARVVRDPFAALDGGAGGGGDAPRTQAVPRTGPMQSPADLWETLRQHGMSPEQATAAVKSMTGGG